MIFYQLMLMLTGVCRKSQVCVLLGAVLLLLV